MKKILLLTNMYPSKEYPHYGVFVKNCEDMLKQEGYSVQPVIITYQTNRWRKVGQYIRFTVQAILKALWERNDYIYAHYASHMMPIVMLLRFLGVKTPIVVNVHGNDIVPTRPAEEKNPARSQKTLEKADLIIAPSVYFKEVLMTQYGVEEYKIRVFSSGGVNSKLFFAKDGEYSRRKIGMDQDLIILGFVGRIEPLKGWDIFLKAVKRLNGKNKKIRYLLIGEGTQEKECKRRIQQLKLEDKGWCYPLQAQTQLADFFSVMDVFCVSSEQESLGLVGIEAMSCGAVCVLSDIPGMQEYAKDGVNCLTFSSGDEQALAEKVQEALCLTEDKKAELKRQAQRTAREYEVKHL